jgi:hypothetical protein
LLIQLIGLLCIFRISLLNLLRKVFGTSYAAREAEILSREALKRRTFKYRGSAVEMLKHLKIGVKDTAETLRIHFEWFADESKIVIGHCGSHLKL